MTLLRCDGLALSSQASTNHAAADSSSARAVATHPPGPITGMELIAVREVARQAVKTTLMAEIRTLIEGPTP